MDKRNRGIFGQWTKTAIECYEIGCRCSKCYLARILETHCSMKRIVLELVRRYGAPKKNADKENKSL